MPAPTTFNELSVRAARKSMKAMSRGARVAFERYAAFRVGPLPRRRAAAWLARFCDAGGLRGVPSLRRATGMTVWCPHVPGDASRCTLRVWMPLRHARLYRPESPDEAAAAALPETLAWFNQPERVAELLRSLAAVQRDG